MQPCSLLHCLAQALQSNTTFLVVNPECYLLLSFHPITITTDVYIYYMFYECFSVLFRHNFNLAALKANHCLSHLVGYFISKTGLELEVGEISSDSPFLRPDLLSKSRSASFTYSSVWIHYRDISFHLAVL